MFDYNRRPRSRCERQSLGTQRCTQSDLPPRVEPVLMSELGHLRVDRVSLPVVPSLSPVAMIDFDDPDGVAANETRQPDTVRPGALDPKGLDSAERARPGHQLGVAAPIRRHAAGPQSGAEAIDGDGDMYVFVRVDPDDHRDGWFDSCDPLRHVVGLHPRLTTPSGREGGQDCDGSLSQAPIRSLPTRPDTIRMSVAGPGRQINARTRGRS